MKFLDIFIFFWKRVFFVEFQEHQETNFLDITESLFSQTKIFGQVKQHFVEWTKI